MPTLVSPQLKLRLIDGFELSNETTLVRVARPAQRLLAFLALQNRAVHRRSVANVLWDSVNDQQSAARLRSTLWRLPTPAGVSLVDVDAGLLRLSAAVEVDVRLARDEMRADELDIDHLCGDVLTDWLDDWVLIERERFRQVRLHRLEQMCAKARHNRHYHFALQASLAAVAIDPLRESAHREVMLTHIAEGNPSEALRQYESARKVLRDELGISPSSATRAIVSDLLGRPLDMRTAS
jgi:DNA-binding SARP family transcriptional activator